MVPLIKLILDTRDYVDIMGIIMDLTQIRSGLINTRMSAD